MLYFSPMKNLYGIILAIGMFSFGCADDAVCGNGKVESGEQCDDSNKNPGDGCTDRCVIETGYSCATGTECDPVCGDSRLVSAEVCDPTTSPGFSQYCSADCMSATGRCGDGVLQDIPEECDDGDSDANDGCANSCAASFGFECENNSCDASTVTPTKTLSSLTSQERTDLCTWFIGVLGGAGHWSYCGATNYQANSVSGCASNIVNAGPNCTVAQMERWVASMNSACGVYESPDATVCP